MYIVIVCICYSTAASDVWKIQHEGWGRVVNTARGIAECCIYYETPPRVLYFPYITNQQCFNSFIVFVWEDYQCYFVVIDSQCDAFSQVSIIGDAFKVYLTRCFVIICHSSVSEWLFNVTALYIHDASVMAFIETS